MTALAAGAAGNLSLEEYLSQVRAGHLGVKAGVEAGVGAAERADEGNLMFMPSLFANAQWMVDEKETSNVALQGRKTTYNSYSFGITEMTPAGLTAKLGYTLGYAAIEGANALYVPVPKGYEGRLSIELSQPLWRNFFGSEMRAIRDMQRAQALAASYGESYRGRMLLAEAEVAFLRLSLARDTVAIQRDSLARSEKLRDWNARRVRTMLADKADLYQSEAALQGRRLELRMALDEELAAARAFNTARGLQKDEVEEMLEKIPSDMIARLPAPSRGELRDDVRSAREQQEAAVRGADVARQKHLPSLEVFGSYTLNGKDAASGEAMSETFKTDYPTKAVGLRLTAPLDWWDISGARAGYAREQAAAGLNYQRKIFEQDREWNDLSVRLEDAKRRLVLAREMETIQHDKLMHERDRLGRGRTTTFQVLMFEQDYAAAQLTHLKMQNEILQITARMKTFGGAA